MAVRVLDGDGTVHEVQITNEKRLSGYIERMLIRLSYGRYGVVRMIEKHRILWEATRAAALVSAAAFVFACRFTARLFSVLFAFRDVFLFLCDLKEATRWNMKNVPFADIKIGNYARPILWRKIEQRDRFMEGRAVVPYSLVYELYSEGAWRHGGKEFRSLDEYRAAVEEAEALIRGRTEEKEES